ncbi:MAG: SURF1 family protein [Boseongicola sp.]|nr:SURF1 family protein [Boseongicola sp.]
MEVRVLVPLIFGVLGCAVLVTLGSWQVQRLAWKTALLAEIDARIGAEPVALPESFDVEADRFLPVAVSGRTLGRELVALTSVQGVGPGYRVVSAFETDAGRRILVDEGFVPSDARDVERPGVVMSIVGNLHWPREVDSFTPEPDLAKGLVFARDVEVMATALGTEAVLLVVREVSGTDLRATPLPVTSTGIPNNHLGYAVQWFGLALVWAGMTAFFLWRMRRGRREDMT